MHTTYHALSRYLSHSCGPQWYRCEGPSILLSMVDANTRGASARAGGRQARQCECLPYHWGIAVRSPSVHVRWHASRGDGRGAPQARAASVTPPVAITNPWQQKADRRSAAALLPLPKWLQAQRRCAGAGALADWGDRRPLPTPTGTAAGTPKQNRESIAPYPRGHAQ